MTAYVKENVRQTTGAAASSTQIADGTASGNATVQPTITTTPTATDNPLLVRAIMGDEVAICDLIPVVAAGYSPADLTPGARNLLFNASMIVGPDSVTNTAVRPVSVLDGIGTTESPGDNPLLVRPAARTNTVVQDGGQVSCAAGASTVLAAANQDRMFLSIKNNSGSTVTIVLAGTADANDTELADGESFTMEAGNAIYTGAVAAWNATGGALLVNVMEF